VNFTGTGRDLHRRTSPAPPAVLTGELHRIPAGCDDHQQRERVAIEHRLAHLSNKQGRRARYVGTRKNLLDLRRYAALLNLETIQRREAARLAEAA
jgi:hypothetical protein